VSSYLQYIIGKHLLPPRTGGEQHKDNNDNNNIINYVEFNTDSILDLSEKNYEHLVELELLTNNAIDTIPSTTSSLQQNSTSYEHLRIIIVYYR
jgi:hypothetical protein